MRPPTLEPTRLVTGPVRAPAAPANPVFGLAFPMRTDPLGTMRRAFEQCGDGDAVFLRLGPYKATIFRNPEHIKRIFVDNAANYSKQTRGYRKAKLVLGEGLVTSEGELWQRQRRIAQPAFHRQRIAGLADVMVAATEELIAGWLTAAPAVDLERDVFAEMMRVTLRIAVQTLFGIEPSPRLSEVSAAVSEVLERTNDVITNPISLPIWTPLPKYRRFKRALRVLDAFVYETIAARRGETVESVDRRGDLLSMLLSARDEQTGQTMSDRQLRDEAVTILIAGHETTANALAWALWLLGMHAGIQEEVSLEVARALSDDSRPAGVGDLANLRLTRAVVDEAMRLYPPAWMIGRYAIADDALGPYRLRAGEFALISPYMTHRYAKLWDDPDRFDPARFLDGRAERLPKFAYLPFGGGQRFCIGANFALMQATLMLATLIRRVSFQPAPEHPVEPYAMITLRPRYGIRMRIRARNRG